MFHLSDERSVFVATEAGGGILGSAKHDDFLLLDKETENLSLCYKKQVVERVRFAFYFVTNKSFSLDNFRCV